MIIYELLVITLREKKVFKISVIFTFIYIMLNLYIQYHVGMCFNFGVKLKMK